MTPDEQIRAAALLAAATSLGPNPNDVLLRADRFVDYIRGSEGRPALVDGVEPDFMELVESVGAGGLTAKVAARLWYRVDEPTRGQVEKVRRRLDKLTDRGLLVRESGQRGGGAETVWFPDRGKWMGVCSPWMAGNK
ncbi:hypothetical protein [Mycolicibacterium porcinum]|uniref:MarR family transcriptional regulator n=1 Tax=Mycolicibacterium porcinum TaxID=39693 RepID=A0ABV3VNT6_9MYCO